MSYKQLFSDLESAKKEREKFYPAFDELLLYALERRHLDTPAITDAVVENIGVPREYFSTNARFFKIEELAFDADEEIHLPGVESAISAMRDSGVSLIFMVHGNKRRAHVYMGVVNFYPDTNSSDECIQRVRSAANALESVVLANFPGSVLHLEDTDRTVDISNNLKQSNYVGALSGIPSLKREEEMHIFVQGLERLIRAMRGKKYTWLSIADPIPIHLIRDALDACRNLQTEIHSLVKTTLSEAVAKGKTVQLGLFGMKGLGTTDGKSHTNTRTLTAGHTTGDTQNYAETYQRVGAGVASVVVPICTAIGGPIGGVLGSVAASVLQGVVNNVGLAITGKTGHSHTRSTSLSTAQSFSDTTSHAISQQTAGGAFGSMGLSWTKTSTVSEEMLNRKAQYVEEVLQAYEDRLKKGMALGMWNLGHYLCTEDERAYRLGCGVITSLFSGMDSTHEPPRAIHLPKEMASILSRFSNIYFTYCVDGFDFDRVKNKKQGISDHPLGVIFNGPATPVNTKELAIVAPFATQDVEGVTVSKRASFGINVLSNAKSSDQKCIELGKVLDKGNELSDLYSIQTQQLTKHVAVFGLTGSGKTNTVHHMLTELWKKNRTPFMVIEPAKAEYRALSGNDELSDELLIISAGVNQTSVCPLRLNPFSFNPGKDCDANRIHVLTHIDRLKSTFNAVFPMYGPMPYILEEAILQVYQERGWDLGRSQNIYTDIYSNDFSDYIPTLNDLCLKVDSIVRSKGYFQEQQMNIQAALKARLQSLMVGAKGSMFNCSRSISDDELWNRPVVVELENMGDDDEKAFLMGLLISRLYEYRKATYSDAQLKHVLVIEEAHRLLSNVPESSSGGMESANVRGKAVSAFIDMLSEVRSYGQSVVVVDQLPSRVSPNIVKGTGSKIVHRLLAKDDRESVGFTMGLTPEQVDYLSLLHTGECVVSQDDDAKAFLCKVDKSAIHDHRQGSEVSGYTKKFKEAHADLFDGLSDVLCREDERVFDAVYKVMMAIGSGKQELVDLRKTLQRTCPHEKDRQAVFGFYWKAISQSIWDYYQGNYRSFVRMYKKGMELYARPDVVRKDYVGAVRQYILGTSLYTFSASGEVDGVLFSHICERKKLVSHINMQFERLRYANDANVSLGKAVCQVMPMLEIAPGIKLHMDLRLAIIREILAHLPISRSRIDNILQYIKSNI